MFLIHCVCIIYITFFKVNNGACAETEVTQLIFTITVKEDIPICANGTIKGPIRAQQKFQISAISSDKEFGSRETTCRFNDENNNGSIIRLEPKPGDSKKLAVVSEVLHFKSEMQGRRLVCELGLDMKQRSNATDQQPSYSMANCTIYMHLEETTGSTRTINSMDSYKVLTIVYSVGGVLVLVIIAQAIAMCIYGSRAVSSNEKEDTGTRGSNTRSNIAERGTIYEGVVNNRGDTCAQTSSAANQEPPPIPPKRPKN